MEGEQMEKIEREAVMEGEQMEKIERGLTQQDVRTSDVNLCVEIFVRYSAVRHLQCCSAIPKGHPSRKGTKSVYGSLQCFDGFEIEMK